MKKLHNFEYKRNRIFLLTNLSIVLVYTLEQAITMYLKFPFKEWGVLESVRCKETPSDFVRNSVVISL